MKPFILFLVSFFYVLHVHGQKANMEEVLAQADSLYDVANDFYYDGDYKDAESGFLYLRSFLERAQLDTSWAFAKTTWKLGDVHRRLRSHKQALSYYAATTKLFEALPKYEEQELDLADIQLDRARVYSQMYEPQRAIATYDSSLVVYRSHFGDKHASVGNTLMNSGIDLTKAGQYKDAEKRFLEAFDIFKEVSDSTSEDFNRIYSNLGYLYRKKGDYNRALTYCKKALEIKLLNYESDHPSVSKYHANIGKALQRLGRQEEAIPYFKEAYEIYNVKLGPESPSTVGALGELGDAYAEVGDFKQASEIYSYTGRMLEKVYPVNHPYRIAYTFNIGMLHEDQGNYEAAILAYDKTRKELEEIPEPPQILLSDAEYQIAYAYLKAGATDLSLSYVDTALLRIAPELVSLKWKEGDKLPVFQAELNVLDLLWIRAEAYAARAQSKDTLQSLETIELAIEIVNQLRQSYPTEEARQYLRDESGELFELGILFAQRLYQSTGDFDFLRRALELSNAAKTGMLKDAFREKKARELAGIPQQEADEIEELAATLRACKSAYSDQPSQDTKVRLAIATVSFQNAETALRFKYPKYAFLKSVNYELDLSALQDKLIDKQAFLDYVLVDSICFVSVITANNVESFEVKLPANFDELLNFVITSFQKPDLNSKNSQQAVIDALARLDNILIDSIREELSGKEELIVSPWGILHQLPFETLIQSEAHHHDYRSPKYLVHDYSVSYLRNVSALMDEAMLGKYQADSDQYLLGVAPTFGATAFVDSDINTRQNQLSPLPFTTIELAGIAKTFKSVLLRGEEATESDFLNEAAKYSMLHLASHARLDDSEPLSSGIYFSPSPDSTSDAFLSAAEIYGLNLTADLAVLSACNTGAGRLQSGDGILSLAHAFRYAGCKSVVASSWLANDQSTADITTEFYKQLAEGLPKNRALQQAKLHYLESSDALSAHPFFWAGLTLRGDVTAIDKPSTSWWLYGAGLGLLSIGLFFLRRRG